MQGMITIKDKRQRTKATNSATKNRDVPESSFPNPAGAGAGARFKNQRKTRMS